MKLLVIGAQLSGKSTLVRYLRKVSDIPVFEIDEEILSLNNNEWPIDNNYKDTVLIPRIYQSIASKGNAIFFIQSAFPISSLQQFKTAGFKIILLELSREEIAKRNEQRMKKESYKDAMPWIDGQLDNHSDIVTRGFIDERIDATNSVDSITSLLLKST